MDREQQNRRRAPADADLFLQWGNRKRLRCVKARDDGGGGGGGGQRRTATRVNRRILRGVEKDQHLSSPPLPLPPPPQPTPSQNHRASESAGSESRKPTISVSSSPEKEDRFYMTRGSAAVAAAVYRRITATEWGTRKAWLRFRDSSFPFLVKQGEGGGFHGDEGLQAAAETKEAGEVLRWLARGRG